MSPLWLVLLSAVYAVALVVVIKIKSDDERALIHALISRSAQEYRSLDRPNPARPRPALDDPEVVDRLPIRPMGL